MWRLALIVASVTAFMILTRISGPLALLFLLGTVISVPAIVIHRRELAEGVDLSHEGESQLEGLVRLLKSVGLDTTGITLGVVILLVAVLIVRALGLIPGLG